MKVVWFLCYQDGWAKKWKKWGEGSIKNSGFLQRGDKWNFCSIPKETLGEARPQYRGYKKLRIDQPDTHIQVRATSDVFKILKGRGEYSSRCPETELSSSEKEGMKESSTEEQVFCYPRGSAKKLESRIDFLKNDRKTGQDLADSRFVPQHNWNIFQSHRKDSRFSDWSPLFCQANEFLLQKWAWEWVGKIQWGLGWIPDPNIILERPKLGTLCPESPI